MRKRFGLRHTVTLTSVLVLGIMLSRCTSPRQIRTHDRSAAKAAPTLPQRVWVLLSGLENKREFQVQLGAASAGESTRLEFRKDGANVVCSDNQRGQSLTFQLRAPFQINGRQYLGNLKVKTHAEGGLRALVQIGLEHYVEGVVAAELPLWSSLPAELQAQAIAVRTYTVAALNRKAGGPGGFLWDGVQDQAFHGNYRPGPSRGEQSAAVRLRRAVEATRGQVLLEQGRLLDVRYHAACGGHTADRSTIFPGTSPSTIVACAPCEQRATTEAGLPANRRPLTWSLHLSKPECLALADRWGLGTRLLKLAPSQLDGAGRWRKVRLNGNFRAADVPLDLMRKHLGYSRLKSGRIIAVEPASGTPDADGLTLTGLGRGHGVGLCQEGIHDYAAQGMGSQAILGHYYPGSHVERLDIGPLY
ncbi:MAG: SpoIID/LytB domain-containing protein [bacterium]|nr:SpoIID/LytB domain-containing protein [bacterium]